MLQYMRIQAIIFDRDNTLVHFDSTRVEAVGARIASIAPELPAAAPLGAWRRWPGPWPRHVDEEPAFWRRFWTTLGQEHSLSDRQVAALAAEVAAIYHTCFTAFPDTALALAELRAAGLRLALLTNFELPSVDRTLAGAGIDPALFDAIHTGVGLGIVKPDPRAFLAVAAELGLPPAACAVVDDLGENVAAARSIGMRGVQIDRSLPLTATAADRIGSLGALLELLLPPFIRA
jgi:FMN phosphatase YigB (HAD superfamily)